jgi:hypothetical protein
MSNYNLRYRAGSWDQALRVVVKIAWHAGELFPRVLAFRGWINCST